VLLIHPTGTSSAWFEPVAGRLADDWQVLTYDRPGWGRSKPPDEYRKTSIAEQAIVAAGVLRDRGVNGVRVLGVGLGAVVALELALAEPVRVESVVMVEPPVFDTLVAATEGMSDDVAAIQDAAAEGGEEAVWRLYLSGGLPTLGAGAERLPGAGEGSLPGVGGERPSGTAGESAAGPAAAHTLLVELPAVPAWPLDPFRIAGLEAPVTIATMPSSPGLLVEAADSLVPRIPEANRVTTEADGPEAVPGLLGHA
jgi:pimeloyl-ACP methyl ester carboxylesterase